MLILADAIEALTNVRLETATTVITEAAVDSRQVIPGALFVAMRGEHTDGHDYIKDAFGRGASFALIEQEVSSDYLVLDLREALQDKLSISLAPPLCLRVDNTLSALQQIARFWRRKLDLRVIGITGSVGKSTTKELIAEVLSQRYHTLKNPAADGAVFVRRVNQVKEVGRDGQRQLMVGQLRAGDFLRRERRHQPLELLDSHNPVLELPVPVVPVLIQHIGPKTPPRRAELLESLR